MTYDRQEKIKKMLAQTGVVYYKDLEAVFPDVSTMTLRRDMAKLECDGLAVRVRGGARRAAVDGEAREPVYTRRERENVEVKVRIAREALKFLEPERSVFLDSGTTVMEFAKMMPDMKLNILTTGPNIAMETITGSNRSVNMVGGAVNSDNCSVSGAQAMAFIKSVNIDIAFITPSGYSRTGGFTCGNYAESELKRYIIKKANRVILLTAAYKLDKSLPFTFAGLKDADVIITDAKPDNFMIKKEAKIQIITV